MNNPSYQQEPDVDAQLCDPPNFGVRLLVQSFKRRSYNGHKYQQQRRHTERPSNQRGVRILHNIPHTDTEHVRRLRITENINRLKSKTKYFGQFKFWTSRFFGQLSEIILSEIFSSLYLLLFLLKFSLISNL